MMEAAGTVEEREARGETKLLPVRKTKKCRFFCGRLVNRDHRRLPGWRAKYLSAAGNSTRVTPDFARPRRMIGFSFPL